MKVYIATYCPCIFESSYGVISVHKTKRGAEVAMEFHKEEEREIMGGVGAYEEWRVDEHEVKTVRAKS